MFLNLHWGFQMNVHFNMNSIKMFEKKTIQIDTPQLYNRFEFSSVFHCCIKTMGKGGFSCS